MSDLTEKIVLGTAQFGLDYGINNSSGKIKKVDVEAILNFAHQNQISTIDTAVAYGNAHDVIGSFHNENPNKTFKVITKIVKDAVGIDIQGQVKRYVMELKVPRLHTFMFHSYAAFKNFGEKEVPLLSQLKNSGLVEKVGVSIYNNQEAEALLSSEIVDVVQLPFNLLDNVHHRAEIVKKLKRTGKEVHARSTFLQGLFFKNLAEDNKITKSLKMELSMLNRLTEKHQIPMTQMALLYSLQQKNIDKVLIGVDSLAHLSENIEISKNVLPNSLMEEINNIFVSNSKLLNPSLW